MFILYYENKALDTLVWVGTEDIINFQFYREN